MRVAYLARTAPGSWKVGLADALTGLGHQVDHVDDTAPAGAVWEVTRGADLLLWARTHHRAPAGVDTVIDRARARGVPTAGVHFDLYWGLGRREAEIGAHPWWRLDHVFTADGHPGRAWGRRGVNHHWLPPGACRVGRADPDPDQARDVVFVGARVHHPEWEYRTRLVDWLTVRYGPRFAWYGPRSRLGEARGERLARLVASARVVVGDSCNPGYTVTRYWSDRLPVMLGLGALLVHPWVGGMRVEGYAGGETLVTYPFGDFAALRAAIDGWLADETARRDVADAGMALVAARHTMTHRAARILEVVTR